MKQRKLHWFVSGGSVALFVMTLVLGLLSNQSQTMDLTEEDLIDELFAKGVLEVRTNNTHYYRFLDPILTSIAIESAVAGSPYEGRWEVNHDPIQSNSINIFTINSAEWDFDAEGPFCIFRKNAIYLPNHATIVVDVRAAHVITQQTGEPDAYVGAVMAWIIGHEIGHAVLRHHRRSFFGFEDLTCGTPTVERLVRLFSSCLWRCKDHQEVELEADWYFARQIMNISNGSEVMIQFLLPLLGNIYQSPSSKNSERGTHPSHSLRAVELLEDFACDIKVDEEFRNELIDLLVVLSDNPAYSAAVCAERSSTR